MILRKTIYGFVIIHMGENNISSNFEKEKIEHEPEISCFDSVKWKQMKIKIISFKSKVFFS